MTSNGGGENSSGDKMKFEGTKKLIGNDSRNRGDHDGDTCGGNGGGIRGCASDRSSSPGGSIINSSGQHIKLPITL